MAWTETDKPFGGPINQAPTFTGNTDVGIAKTYPAFYYSGTESNAVYYESREVSGDLWFATNAIWTVNATYPSGAWLISNNALSAYAMVRRGPSAANPGATEWLTAPSGSGTTAIAWSYVQRWLTTGVLSAQSPNVTPLTIAAPNGQTVDIFAVTNTDGKALYVEKSGNVNINFVGTGNPGNHGALLFPSTAYGAYIGSNVTGSLDSFVFSAYNPTPTTGNIALFTVNGAVKFSIQNSGIPTWTGALPVSQGGTGVISLLGNIVTTGDTGTVTNAMLAGSIAQSKLAAFAGLNVGGALTGATTGAFSGVVTTPNVFATSDSAPAAAQTSYGNNGAGGGVIRSDAGIVVVDHTFAVYKPITSSAFNIGGASATYGVGANLGGGALTGATTGAFTGTVTVPQINSPGTSSLAINYNGGGALSFYGGGTSLVASISTAGQGAFTGVAVGGALTGATTGNFSSTLTVNGGSFNGYTLLSQYAAGNVLSLNANSSTAGTGAVYVNYSNGLNNNQGLRVYDGGTTTFARLGPTGADLGGGALTGATTGTFSDTITSTKAGQVFNAASGNTGIQYAQFTNTGGSMLIGLEQAAANGLLLGSASYAAIFGTTGARAVQFGTNNNVRVTIDGTTGATTFTASAIATNHVANAAAASGGAGTVSYGGTTASTVGAAGAASALPATPLGYIIINVGGTQCKIPYYNT